VTHDKGWCSNPSLSDLVCGFPRTQSHVGLPAGLAVRLVIRKGFVRCPTGGQSKGGHPRHFVPAMAQHVLQKILGSPVTERRYNRLRFNDVLFATDGTLPPCSDYIQETRKVVTKQTAAITHSSTVISPNSGQLCPRNPPPSASLQLQQAQSVLGSS